ncbi:MAG: hypothetical protein U1F35_18675 [Steroidobacteraceae bacterium]
MQKAAIIADAGFGGFEIADVRDSVTDPIDPRTQGWGSPAWMAAIRPRWKWLSLAVQCPR